MKIKSLALNNFRNLENINIEFDDGINIFYGDNAQGKTNILESIYVAGTTKSHKGCRDRELINFNKDEGHIRLILEKDRLERKIDVHLKKNKAKGVAVDGIPVHKFSEIFGLVQLVFFSPEDLSMIKDGPNLRRRFIDMELSQIEKIYLYNLTKYNKILLQRNNLLKQISFNEKLEDTLDVWDKNLIFTGVEIIKSRRKFIDELDKIIKPIHKDLTGNRENIRIEYLPNVSEDRFENRLVSERKNDIYQKTTLIGPQRDDIVFYINEQDVRKFGSQGQQRSTALSLKLSEIELFKKFTGEKPIFLLDDVLSELDVHRQNFLIDVLGDIQTIITCTGLDEFIKNRKESSKIFRVENGKIR